MAYNFPVGYQPAQLYYPQQYAQAPQTQTSSIIWVQGEAGAKSYMVAPNSTVQLWDSENQVIYLKSSDASGMPSMKVLDYTIRESQQSPGPAIQATEYVTRAEMESFQKHIQEQLAGLKKEAEHE